MEILPAKENAGFLNVNHLPEEWAPIVSPNPCCPMAAVRVRDFHECSSGIQTPPFFMRPLRDVMLSNRARDKEMGFSQYFDNDKDMDGYIKVRFPAGKSHPLAG